MDCCASETFQSGKAVFFVCVVIFSYAALPPFPPPKCSSFCRVFNLGRSKGGEIESARNTARQAQQPGELSPTQPAPAVASAAVASTALAPDELRPELLTLLENNNVLPAEEPR